MSEHDKLVQHTSEDALKHTIAINLARIEALINVAPEEMATARAQLNNDMLYSEVQALNLKHPVLFLTMLSLSTSQQSTSLDITDISKMPIKEQFQWLCLCVTNQQKHLGLGLPVVDITMLQLFDEMDRMFSFLEAVQPLNAMSLESSQKMLYALCFDSLLEKHAQILSNLGINMDNTGEQEDRLFEAKSIAHLSNEFKGNNGALNL